MTQTSAMVLVAAHALALLAVAIGGLCIDRTLRVGKQSPSLGDETFRATLRGMLGFSALATAAYAALALCTLALLVVVARRWRLQRKWLCGNTVAAAVAAVVGGVSVPACLHRAGVATALLLLAMNRSAAASESSSSSSLSSSEEMGNALRLLIIGTKAAVLQLLTGTNAAALWMTAVLLERKNAQKEQRRQKKIEMREQLRRGNKAAALVARRELEHGLTTPWSQVRLLFVARTRLEENEESPFHPAAMPQLVFDRILLFLGKPPSQHQIIAKRM